jgi:hypothetical protein
MVNFTLSEVCSTYFDDGQMKFFSEIFLESIQQTLESIQQTLESIQLNWNLFNTLGINSIKLKFIQQTWNWFKTYKLNVKLKRSTCLN